MKNKIFLKDWVDMHPYHKSQETDLYFVGLANRHILIKIMMFF
jgi:hypothetical protein